jgi:hypothetical protein
MKRKEMAKGKLASRLIRLLAERPWLLAVACLGMVGVAGLLLLGSRRGSIDEQLRAIDAAHAVPEGQNAAGIYTELAWDNSRPALNPLLLPQSSSVTLRQPWRSVEYPQTAEWIKERQVILDVLLEASRKPQCWFSVFEARWQSGRRTDAASEWSQLLLQAANNDLGEGRADAGLEKVLCMFRLAQHFSSQGNPWDYLTGVGVASTGLRRFKRLVITEEVTPEWLAKFEGVLPAVEDMSMEQSRELDEVRRLYMQEHQRGVIGRLMSIFTSGTSSGGMSNLAMMHKAECRAARILLALRRCRDETGTWPADLKEIESRIPGDALRDPISDKPFVYRLSRDGFLLYSVSTNGTDEGGKFPGDFSFWPRP